MNQVVLASDRYLGSVQQGRLDFWSFAGLVVWGGSVDGKLES